MAADGMDYDKWNLLDVSSDDDPADHHPNVDPKLIRRLKKEKKQREREQEIENLKREVAAGGPEAAAAKKLLDQYEEAKKPSFREIPSRTIINTGSTATAPPSSAPKYSASLSDPDHDSVEGAKGAEGDKKDTQKRKKKEKKGIDPFKDTDDAFLEFSRLYSHMCYKYAKLQNFDESYQYLLDNHQVLLHKHAQSCILLKMLDLEMEGKTSEMKDHCRQYLMLANILDLARGMNADPRAALRPFFDRVRTKETLQNLVREVENFSLGIQKRAEQKKAEAAAEEAEEEDGQQSLEEMSREERLGPGGLDPVEVFEELPPSWQEAFSQRDMEMLQKAIHDVPLEEAQRLLKLCEDSGLWNPGGSGDEDESAESEQNDE